MDRAPNIGVVGEAEDGPEALAQMDALRPDVAVLGCQLAGMEGVAVAREIQRRNLPVRVLALSAYDSEQYVRRMLEAGAAGYLLKEEAPETIVAAVRAAARGKVLLSGEQYARARRWAEEVGERFGLTRDVYQALRMLDKPLVAAINGVAAGGGLQITLCADIRVGHSGTRMGQPEINAGLPSIMGSFFMTLFLGLSKNIELSMTGRLMDAEECRELGLLNRLVPSEHLMPEALGVARARQRNIKGWVSRRGRKRE